MMMSQTSPAAQAAAAAVPWGSWEPCSAAKTLQYLRLNSRPAWGFKQLQLWQHQAAAALLSLLLLAMAAL